MALLCKNVGPTGSGLPSCSLLSRPVVDLDAIRSVCKGRDKPPSFMRGFMTEHEPQHSQQNLQELLTLLAQGKIKPHISATYPLERAADALNDLMNRKVKGKAILVTGG